MYIRSLHISNLRNFADAELAFQYPGRPDGASALPNVNLLLGDNGAGKTTVLKAIALAILSPALESSGFLPYRLVRRSKSGDASLASAQASVVLHAQDSELVGNGAEDEHDLLVQIERYLPFSSERVKSPLEPTGLWTNMVNDQSPAFLLVGYGASRRVEGSSTFDEGVRAKSRQFRYQRVAGLFEEQVTLTPLGAWLPRYTNEDPHRYEQAVELINRLLPTECRFSGEMDEGDFLFEHRSIAVPFSALSDGYRAYIGWVTDLLYHLCMGSVSGEKLVDRKGIVLVDEIDLHLHPEWQRVVVPTLSRALPNLQFVLSSHSPIVAGTMESANILVMETDESGASIVRRLHERIHGLNADQILLSSYFNLTSSRAPEAVDELHELARQAQTGDPKAAIAFLRTLSGGSGSKGS